MSKASVLDVAVDATAPGAPIVTSTHASGIPTTSRHLTATYEPAAGDSAEEWSVVVDRSPATRPGEENATTRERINVILEVGTSWLHVSARDTAGRWGEPTHIQLVVVDAPWILLEPGGRMLWGTATLDMACPDDISGAGLAVVAENGTERVVDLARSGDGCRASWNVADTDEGRRKWSDGKQRVVVVDSADNPISDEVELEIDVDSTTAERLLADYSVGLVSSDELARYLVLSLTNPSELPAKYSADAGVGDVTSVDVIRAITGDGEISDEILELLTPDDQTPPARSSFRSSGQVCGKIIVVLKLTMDCLLLRDNFTVYFHSSHVGEKGDDGSYPWVTMIGDELERARAAYINSGFRYPNEKMNVYLSWLMPPGVGLSLPALGNGHLRVGPSIRMSSMPDRVSQYLPHHELFHQVQYSYVSAAQVAREVDAPYWWLEATAEWGAHLVSDGSGETTQTGAYAARLGTFLAGANGPVDQGGLESSGGPEYGAFILAEFLEEQYGGVSAIARTWELIGSGWWGTSPVRAIEKLVVERGGTFADAIHRFRVATYALSAGGGIGFTDPHAEPGGLWHRTKGAGVPKRLARLDAGPLGGEGSVDLAPTGGGYIELEALDGAMGDVSLTVSGPPGNTAASLISIGQFPEVCGSTAISIADGKGVGSVRLTARCPTAVLVMTSTRNLGRLHVSRLGIEKEKFGWSAKLSAGAVKLTNGYLEMGVTDVGTVIAEGVGLRRAGSPASDVLDNGCACEGWGLSDGVSHGGGVAGGTTGDYLPSYFDFSSDIVTVYGTVGGLAVTHEFRRSASANLLAVDVTVARATWENVERDVTYRRHVDFDVRPTPTSEFITWGMVDGARNARVKVLTNDPFGSTDPIYAPTELGSVGIVDRYGPKDQGGMIDLDLGHVSPETPVHFTLFFGIGEKREQALAAIADVEADVYLLAEPNLAGLVPEEYWTAEERALATNTGVFAYKEGSLVRSRGARNGGLFDLSPALPSVGPMVVPGVPRDQGGEQ